MALPVFRRSDAGVRLAHIGVREPCLPFGVTIEVQVPPWTNFHELPWKSTVELPWQVVPGPAAQSFWPLRATPKHFSLWAAIAAAFSASVKGPAEAMVASALESAKARTSEATAVLADMRFLRFVGWPSSGALGRRVRVRKRYIGPLRKNDATADGFAAETRGGHTGRIAETAETSLRHESRLIGRKPRGLGAPVPGPPCGHRDRVLTLNRRRALWQRCRGTAAANRGSQESRADRRQPASDAREQYRPHERLAPGGRSRGSGSRGTRSPARPALRAADR